MKFFLQILFPFLFVTQLGYTQWIQTSGPSGISCFASSGLDLFAGSGTIGVYYSSNQGYSWTAVNSGLRDSSISCLAVSETNLFAGTPSGIYRSMDNGSSWTVVDTIMLRYVQDLAVSTPNLFAGTLSGVYLSTNNGTSWTAVNNGLTETFVNELAINGPNLFAATQNGVFLSTNSGTNWFSAGLSNHNVNLLEVINNTLFAAVIGAGVYTSTDNGASWSISDSGLTEQGILDFEVYETNVFASTLNSVFLTMDYGISWAAVDTGLAAFYISSLGVNESNLFAGTMGSGIWRRSLSEMIMNVEDGLSEIPIKFLLSQNYPNPFNPSTKIRYSVPKKVTVMIKVFNILGSEIETLIKEEKLPGAYEITFNAANFPSGVYFYRIQAGNFVKTRKMILLK